jgi:2-methylisocitrate lyase-like PEP mutase family enzyme
MLAFGKTPILSAQELEQMGFKMMVAPIDSVLVTARVMRELAQAFQRDGHTRALSKYMVNFEDIKTILGLPHYNALRERLAEQGK